MHEGERLQSNSTDWDAVLPDNPSLKLIESSTLSQTLVFDVEDAFGEKLNGTNGHYVANGSYVGPYVAYVAEEYFFKRPIDVALSLIGMVVCFPLWIVIALAIWIEDRGPVLYFSERVGKHGRTFKHFKFRTMVPDCHARFGPVQAQENDHRVTRVGRILRATAMDEIPQLWHILKGDMSFVGPRALLPVEIEVKQASTNGKAEAVSIEKIPGHWERHVVKPGLTGIAQIFAPRDIVRRRKFQYDLLYIKRQSLFLDIKLIVLSFWITLRGKWECRGCKL
jgi:lipopolysaccharide/colanic/teichoic acid biosynthesis glycosyltransferase